MMNDKRLNPAAFAMILLPSAAYANAGTPLMWASMSHLYVGNAILGVFEGFLLILLFRGSKLKSIPALIAANYASTWAGGMVLLGYLTKQVDMTIENVARWIYVFIAIAFSLTLIIEFPFFLVALGKTKNAFRRAVIAVVLIHGLSYLLLAGLYTRASANSMMTDLHVVSTDQMGLPEGYRLYYIDPDGSSIIQSDLAGKSPSRIKTIRSHHRDDRLFARAEEGGKYDLFSLIHANERGPGVEEKVLAGFSTLAPVDRRIAEGHVETPDGTWFNFGVVPKISTDEDWEYQTGFWAAEGIHGKSVKENAEFRFAVETLFAQWAVRNATHIDGNFVVFQLGPDQICVLQPIQKQIALIARGKGPIVARHDNSG